MLHKSIVSKELYLIVDSVEGHFQQLGLKYDEKNGPATTTMSRKVNESRTKLIHPFIFSSKINCYNLYLF